MKRRLVVAGFAGAALAVAGLVSAQSAGTTRKIRVGWLSSVQGTHGSNLPLFIKQMAELGYVEERNLILLIPPNREGQEILRVKEVLAMKPDVIVTTSSASVQGLKQASNAVPVVFTWIGDPVAAGLAASLAHPGGNMTGATSGVGNNMYSKCFEFLKMFAPGLKHVGVLYSDDPSHRQVLKVIETYGQSISIPVISAIGRTPTEVQSAMPKLARQGAGALIVLGGFQHATMRKDIAAAALQAKLPAFGSNRLYVEDGLLFSYGVSPKQQMQVAARCVDKIIRGAKPGDIPIEQPATFEFVINRKTANGLGIQLTQDVLLRADEVIE